MVSNRPYRAALTPEQAVAELRRGADSQFDPNLVEHVCELVGAPHSRVGSGS